MYRTHIMQQVRKRRILHEVSLELTYKCNLNCFFCYNDLDKKGVLLSLAQYETLLNDLAEMGTLYLMLTGGEPMVHPHFFEIGELAKRLGFVVRIRTNGDRLSKNNVQRLKDEVDPYCVEVSLHGAKAESHDKQTRVPGSFNKLITNIGHCKNTGLDVRAVSTPTAWNEHEIPEMLDLCDLLDIALRFQGPVAPRDNGDLTPLEISPKQQTWEMIEQISSSQNIDIESQHPSNKPVEIPIDSVGKPVAEPAATCSVGVAGVDIDPYGNVQACMHLQQSAGNLHKHSISDIWNDSPLFRHARQRAIEAAKRIEGKPMRQLGAPLYCLAVEENLNKANRR